MTQNPQNCCKNCGHEWFPRGHNLSARCPECGSPSVDYTFDYYLQHFVGQFFCGLFLFYLIVLGVIKSGVWNKTKPFHPWIGGTLVFFASVAVTTLTLEKLGIIEQDKVTKDWHRVGAEPPVIKPTPQPVVDDTPIVMLSDIGNYKTWDECPYYNGPKD